MVVNDEHVTSAEVCGFVISPATLIVSDTWPCRRRLQERAVARNSKFEDVQPQSIRVQKSEEPNPF